MQFLFQISFSLPHISLSLKTNKDRYSLFTRRWVKQKKLQGMAANSISIHQTRRDLPSPRDERRCSDLTIFLSTLLLFAKWSHEPEHFFIFRSIIRRNIASAISILRRSTEHNTLLLLLIYSIGCYISKLLFRGTAAQHIFLSRPYTCVWCFMIFIVAMTIYINDCCCYNSIYKIDCA